MPDLYDQEEPEEVEPDEAIMRYMRAPTFVDLRQWLDQTSQFPQANMIVADNQPAEGEWEPNLNGETQDLIPRRHHLDAKSRGYKTLIRDNRELAVKQKADPNMLIDAIRNYCAIVEEFTGKPCTPTAEEQVIELMRDMNENGGHQL